MAKPKNLEQLRAEKERAETQLLQEQHKLERLEKVPSRIMRKFICRLRLNEVSRQ